MHLTNWKLLRTAVSQGYATCGIIIVDFIDMKLMENKKRLGTLMDQFMQ